MSDHVDGLLITIADRSFFIPRDDLSTFRLPESATIPDDDGAEEVSGFISAGTTSTSTDPVPSPTVSLRGVRFDPVGGEMFFSSVMGHALTRSRVC